MVGEITVVEPDTTKFMLTVNFTEMTPHVGQNLWLAVVDTSSGMEVGRVNTVATENFFLSVDGLEADASYFIDFYADFNGNGRYDAPPADHAWRLSLDSIMSDTTLTFIHNTNFTDISIPTSILSENEFARVKLYPNPVNDRVWIETGDIDLREVVVSGYDITGKINHIKQKTLYNRIEFDAVNLRQGIYFVELKSPNHKKTIKMIKR